MAKDIFHEAVKIALGKDGWTITHDPLYVEALGFNVRIDLGAERLIGAQKNGEKIAVEVKSFTSPSGVSQFHTALGQFLNYHDALADEEPDRQLFLAIPADAYETTFMIPFVERAIHRYQIMFLVYDPGQEVIVSWHK
ncbi:MAG: XisH family protein [Anaerolineales bacterium]